MRSMAWLCAMAVAAPCALAQPRCMPMGAARQPEARSLFVEGSSAVEAGRWSDAITLFQRSYDLSCAPAAIYNLALALRALGRHREARDTFTRLLRDHPDMNAELRGNASNYQREESARVAVLELVGVDTTPPPQIRLDGAAVQDTGQRPLRVETDAGTHSLVAEIPEHRPFLWNGSLTDGQHLGLQLQFAPLPTTPGGFDWTPVILISAIGAAVIAGVIIGAVLAQDAAQLQPTFPDRTVRL